MGKYVATKKQKRLEAQAKREKFMAEYRAEGLKAQSLDRKNREDKELQQAKTARDRNRQYENAINLQLEAYKTASVKKQKGARGCPDDSQG